jgi:hypothetical protein
VLCYCQAKMNSSFGLDLIYRNSVIMLK